MSRRRVGIVGFGHLGQYLYTAITTDARVSAKLEVGVGEERGAGTVRVHGIVRWPASAGMMLVAGLSRYLHALLM